METAGCFPGTPASLPASVAWGPAGSRRPQGTAIVGLSRAITGAPLLQHLGYHYHALCVDPVGHTTDQCQRRRRVRDVEHAHVVGSHDAHRRHPIAVAMLAF